MGVVIFKGEKKISMESDCVRNVNHAVVRWMRFLFLFFSKTNEQRVSACEVISVCFWEE